MTDVQVNLDQFSPPGRQNGDILTAVLDRSKHIESLKASMKNRLLDGTSQTTTQNAEFKPHNELSLSLPNLSDATSVVIISQEVQTRERSSLSNIFDNSGCPQTSVQNSTNYVIQLGVKALSADDSLNITPSNSTAKLVQLSPIGKDHAPGEDAPLIEAQQTPERALAHSSTEAIPSIDNPSNETDPNPMQSPNDTLETNECNGSLNSTLTETSQLDFNPDERSEEVAHRSNHIDNFQGKTQEALLNHNVNGAEEDIDSESATELTKLQSSPKESPRNTLDNRFTPSSISHGDGSSFSSISSLGTSTDASVSATTSSSDAETGADRVPTIPLSPMQLDEQEFVEINLNARNSFEPSRASGSSQDSGIADIKQPCVGSPTHVPQGAKPKRKGLTGFLSRSLFSRRSKDCVAETDSEPGWKLFGKVPPKQAPELATPATAATLAPLHPPTLQQAGHHAPSGPASSPASSAPSPTPDRRRQDSGGGGRGLLEVVQQPRMRQHKKGSGGDVQVLSTTALILENRPQGLPSKDPEEEQRHRQMYEQMVEGAKKKEQKDAKLRKKQLEQQLKHEDAMAAALRVWNTEVLTCWDTMHLTKRVRDLWWTGVPPSVRGKVWKLAIGNDLNLTPELYHICLNRARERLKLLEDWCGDTDSVSSHMSGYSEHSREASVELIKLDVSRTFPQLCIFQRGGPYHEQLQGLLGAYACYRPDVGYVQGMSFIAAVLLLNMEVEEAFICFANLLNRPCQIAFFRLDETLMRAYFDTYEVFFEENLPTLFTHFREQNLTPDLYIIDWMFTLYAKSLPLDVASRVWDVFCRDGEEFLFRTALGLLKLYEEVLLCMDFIHLAQYLTKLPDTISTDQLFRCIELISMSIDKRPYLQVLAANRESREALAAAANSSSSSNANNGTS